MVYDMFGGAGKCKRKKTMVMIMTQRFLRANCENCTVFYEWEQPFFTCEAGGARSKIDRMYCNQHISYQLDHSCSCSALEWSRRPFIQI